MGHEGFTSTSEDEYSKSDDLKVRINGYCKQAAISEKYVSAEKLANVVDEDPEVVISVLVEADGYAKKIIEEDIKFTNPHFSNEF